MTISLVMRGRSSKERPEFRCLRRARRNHGVILRQQALAEGMSAAAIDRRLSAGDWSVVFTSAYVIGGVRITPLVRLAAAVMLAGPGSAACKRSAATLYGLDGFDLSVIEIVTPRRFRCPGVVAHRGGHLTAREIVLVNGIPTTSVHRTLVELGAVVSREKVEDAVECAFRKSLSRQERLQQELERIGGRGSRGSGILRAVIRANAGRPPSWLERRFKKLLEVAGLRGYAREHAALGGKYFIDFAWPRLWLGIEVHSAKWHLSSQRWNKDLIRHNELTAGGWTILHFTWAQIRDNPDAVLEQVRATIRGRI